MGLLGGLGAKLGKRLGGKLGKRLGINKLQKTVDATQQEVKGIANAVAQLSSGGIGEEIDSTPEADYAGPEIDPTGIAAPTFDPGTKEAAMGMFGKPVDGSFDREMLTSAAEGNIVPEDVNELI